MKTIHSFVIDFDFVLTNKIREILFRRTIYYVITNALFIKIFNTSAKIK